jgi:hypothetical protein
VNSPDRWSYIEAPVRSPGSRSGVNCTRVNRSPRVVAQAARQQGLADARKILDQHVSGRQHAQHDEPADVILADDHPVEFVEDAPARNGRLRDGRGLSRAAA